MNLWFQLVVTHVRNLMAEGSVLSPDVAAMAVLLYHLLRNWLLLYRF